MAATASVTDRLFALGEPFIEAHAAHPTVQGLVSGTLPESVARSWLEQDYLFLHEEVRALARLAWQAPPDHQPDVLSLLCGVVQDEIPRHRELAAPFEPDFEDAVMGDPGRAYTTWLLDTAADYSMGLTALLAGLWGYSTLGARLDVPDEPRFATWVESYKSPGFPLLAGRFAAMVDELDLDPDRALSVFLAGLAHGIAFWETP